jgi:hypothetical protein
MAFPITYEARQDGKLLMLVVASGKGKFTKYYSNGEKSTDGDYIDKNVFDTPKVGMGYMSIGNTFSEGIEPVKVTEGASSKLVTSLVAEINKPSK